MASEIIHVCTCCGESATKSTLESKFYLSDSVFFKNNKRTSLCKKCVADLSLNSNGEFELLKFQRVLIMMDKPFLNNILEQSKESAKDKKTQKIDDRGITGHYFRIIAMPQYRNMANTDGDCVIGVSKYIDEDTDDFREMQLFWGQGLSNDEYVYLTEKYRRYTDTYECETPTMEELLQQAAFESLEIRNKRTMRQDVSKNLKNLQDILGAANIKPVQETGANATEQATFGVLIKKYENEKPIPEPEEEWKDVDGIGRYISIWFLGHLCKMLGIVNEYSLMYETEMQKYRVKSPTDETSVEEIEEIGDE